MGLETAMARLENELRRLHEAVRDAGLTVIEDQPRRGDVALVDRFSYAVDDLTGWLEQALVAAREARQAAGAHPPELNRARRALTLCQQRLHQSWMRLGFDLLGYEPMQQLQEFGRQRRGGWSEWANGVLQGLQGCRQPLEQAAQALVECWEEIGERLAVTAISVQTTSIGQQILTRPGEEVANENRRV